MVRQAEHPLFRAVRESDEAAVRRLLAEDPPAVTLRGHMGATPLYVAAESGSLPVVRLLLQAGANARARRDAGDTALHRAATAEIAELLLQAALEVGCDQRNDLQQTPLHTVRAGEVAAVLLRNGASLDARNWQGGTPLHDAGVTKARVLLAAGAEVDTRDTYGRTPLYRAVWNRDAELVDLLLAAGADPAARDEGGESPLHLAPGHGPAEITTRLATALASTGRALAESDTVAGPGRRETCQDAHGNIYSVTGHAVLTRWQPDDLTRPAVIVATEHPTINAMAVDPRRPLLAVAPLDAPIELRKRDDLTVAQVLTDLVGVVALAFSPDGRWLAAATRGETLLLVDAATGKVTVEAEAGERTGSVAFSPDGSTLATACSFQGGAHVRLDRVTGDGRLEPLGEIDRAARSTPAASFVDTIPAVVFTPDGHLVIWETSAIYHEVRPTGWRGDLILADPANGGILWERSIDADITGRRGHLALVGSPFGYFTTPGVTADGKTIAIGLDELVVLLNAANGHLRATHPIAGNANAVLPIASRPGTVGAVATDQAWQQLTLG